MTPEQMRPVLSKVLATNIVADFFALHLFDCQHKTSTRIIDKDEGNEVSIIFLIDGLPIYL